MIFTSPYHVDIPNEDLLTFLFNRTPFKDDHPIWIDVVNPHIYVTLAKAKELVHHLGQGLRDLGIGASHDGNREDVVLTFVENQVMVAPTLLSVISAGGIHATCPMSATTFELARQISLSSPRILICSQKSKQVAEDSISLSKVSGIILLVMVSENLDVVDSSGKSIISPRSLQWRPITDPTTLQTTTACLVYSSGTTGTPKGVRITHSNLVSHLCQMSFHFNPFAQKALSEGEYLRMPAVLQNATILGITVQSLLALRAGMQVYMFKKFHFKDMMDRAQKFRLSVFFLVPAVYSRIAAECTKEQLQNWRFALCGGSPLPLPLKLKIQDMLPHRGVLKINWGMTETTMAGCQTPGTEVDMEASLGRLLPNLKAIVLSPDGKELGANEPGELCLKGPNITKEYFKNPEATKAAFTIDGWFRTGDIVYFSANGKMFITGRVKELLKYKSHQISPTELEGILEECPGVADVGVIGISDGAGNDLPRAYIVPSKISARVTEKDIHEFLNARVSTYKQLRGGVVFVKEIPRNMNAKIMRNVLKEWAEKGRAEIIQARL